MEDFFCTGKGRKPRSEMIRVFSLQSILTLSCSVASSMSNSHEKPDAALLGTLGMGVSSTTTQMSEPKPYPPNMWGEDLIHLLVTRDEGPILAAVFTVQIIEKQAHCDTWWTLPLLSGLVSVLIYGLVVNKLCAQFCSEKLRIELERELSGLLDGVLNAMQAGGLRDPATFSRLQCMRLEINPQRLSVVMWWTQRAIMLLIMLTVSLVFLASSARLTLYRSKGFLGVSD